MKPISFDVAITVSEEKEKAGGGKIGVVSLGFGVGGEAKTNRANSSVSRVKFDVLMALPKEP